MADHADIDHTGLTGVGGEFDYIEITSPVSITATSEATADTVITGSAVAYDGSTPVIVEFFCPYATISGTAGRYLVVVLYDGSSSIGTMVLGINASATDVSYPIVGKRRITPSAATHTYSVRAFRNTGTTSIAAGAGGNAADPPAFLRITKA